MKYIDTSILMSIDMSIYFCCNTHMLKFGRRKTRLMAGLSGVLLD